MSVDPPDGGWHCRARFGVFFALSALMHPISGFIYDRWVVQHTITVVGFSVVGFLALPSIDGTGELVVATILLSVFPVFPPRPRRIS